MLFIEEVGERHGQPSAAGRGWDEGLPFFVRRNSPLNIITSISISIVITIIINIIIIIIIIIIICVSLLFDLHNL